MKIGVLGVNIDVIDLSGILRLIKKWVGADEQKLIATVNPEFVVAARQNPDFKNVLNGADLATCDGVGLFLASGCKLKRVTGVAITESLLKSTDANLKLYLLGGTDDAAVLTGKKFSARVVGAENGGRLDTTTWRLIDNESVIKNINQSGANILLAAFGQVKQEIWLKKNLPRLPKIKVAMGVGGTFDYLSGRIRRAPKWLRILGLEWFFRLITQPRRLGRIYVALFKFSGLFLKDKIFGLN